jgi:hypothetical protein
MAELPITTTEEHYLSAISTRHLTPPRVFTPARGMPTLEVSASRGERTGEGPQAAAKAEWTGSEPAVAVTTPSGERTTESIPMLVGAARQHDLAGTDTPTAERTAVGGLAADGDDTPTAELATTPGPRPKNRIPIIAGGVLVAGIAAVLLARSSGSSSTVEPVAPPVTSVADSVPPKTDATIAAAPVPAPVAHAPDSAAPVAAAAAGGLALDSAAMRMRGGVVGVASMAGRGTGFLADTARGSGLIVTSTALVPTDSVVDIQLDGSTRVRGRVAA